MAQRICSATLGALCCPHSSQARAESIRGRGNLFQPLPVTSAICRLGFHQGALGMVASKVPAKRTLSSSSTDSAWQPQACIQASYLTVPRLVSPSALALSQARLHQDLEGQEEYQHSATSEFHGVSDCQFKYMPQNKRWKILMLKFPQCLLEVQVYNLYFSSLETALLNEMARSHSPTSLPHRHLQSSTLFLLSTLCSKLP